MITRTMTTTTFKERFADREDRIDLETYLEAVRYVREDARRE